MLKTLSLILVLLTLCFGLSRPSMAAPVITGITANPNPIPARGATVTVTAKVADATSLSSVILYETYPNSTVQLRHATMFLGTDGVTYTASIPVDLNTDSNNVGERLYIVAVDPAGNQSSYNVITQGFSNNPPSITTVNYSPNPIPVQGATVTVSARVADPALGLSSVILYETYPNSTVQLRHAQMFPGTDGVTYTASIPVDRNTDSGNVGERLYIVATDVAGLQTSYNVATQGYSSVPPFGSLPVLISADPSHPALSPASVSAGGADLPLTLSGINFVSGAFVLFNGFQLPLASYTSKQITVNIPSSLIAEPGSYAVTVVNPSPSGASNGVNLVVK